MAWAGQIAALAAEAGTEPAPWPDPRQQGPEQQRLRWKASCSPQLLSWPCKPAILCSAHPAPRANPAFVWPPAATWAIFPVPAKRNVNEVSAFSTHARTPPPTSPDSGNLGPRCGNRDADCDRDPRSHQIFRGQDRAVWRVLHRSPLPRCRGRTAGSGLVAETAAMKRPGARVRTGPSKLRKYGDTERPQPRYRLWPAAAGPSIGRYAYG